MGRNLSHCVLLAALLSGGWVPSFAAQRIGRAGVGFSRQLKNHFPSLDFKIRNSRTYAMGLLFNAKLEDPLGGYGMGAKIYRIIFEEPQLTFYGAGTLGVINTRRDDASRFGFQLDATMGCEFHLTGLESVGFSFEFGLSMNKPWSDLVLETVGHSMLTAAVHFYL